MLLSSVRTVGLVIFVGYVLWGARAAEVVVTLNLTTLDPPNVSINTGDRVIWAVEDSTSYFVESYGGEWKSPRFGQPATFSFTFTEAGTYTYRSRDGVAIGAEGTITVRPASTSRPPVEIVAPVEGTFVTDGANVPIYAVVTNIEANIQSVEFFAGTNALGAVTNAPYRWMWPLVRRGDYPLTVRVTDRQGNVATSPPVNVTVDPWNTGRLYNLVRLPTGQFRINYTFGTVYRDNQLESSHDLRIWQTRRAIAPGGFGTWVDEGVSGVPRRFYRLIGRPG